MRTVELQPVGQVISIIDRERDDHWGKIVAEIRLDSSRFEPAALDGLQEFSHVEVIFLLDQVSESAVENRTRHPRENPRWPKVGIFAQRGRRRPNRLGATICQIVSVEGLSLHVRGLDAFNGSPIIDIKPVMAEFLPDRASVREPQWARELMADYF
jgi:tRNA (Thr-GGU) A37 N-methylase